MMRRVLDSAAMLLGQCRGRLNFHAKVINASGILKLVSGYPNARPFGRQLVFAQILRRVEADTRSERSKQEFRRGHAFVVTAILRWLVAHDGVLTRLNFKL